MPAVSVIFAFHRLTPFLRPALRSILTQTFTDFEVLLVDDGVGAGLDPLGDEGRDPRIRFFPVPERRGIVHAHNLALAQARGEFVALMDYDDLCLPERFARQVAALRADPQLGWLGTHARLIDTEDRVLGPAFTLVTAAEHRVFSAYSMPATAPTFMGRTAALRQFPYDTGILFAADYRLCCHLIEHWKVCALPEVLFHYRQHEQQTTIKARAQQLSGAMLNRLLTARRRAGRPEDAPALLAEFATWRDNPPPVDACYAAIAWRCLADDFPLLAVYHARKLLSVRRDAATLRMAAGVLVGAWRRSPRDAVRLGRMFFTGPLRAHGLSPL